MDIQHINQRRVQRTRSQSNCVAAWPIKDLGPKPAKTWLNDAIHNSPYADLATSLWAHYPNLRTATERLGAYVPPEWPCANGESVLRRAISNGVKNVLKATEKGDTFAPRIIALYLAGIVSCVAEVARIAVFGCSKSGEMEYWEYFSEPLHEWGTRHGMVELEAHLVESALRPEEVLGLRYHLLARISTPVDTGYVETYAPSCVEFTG